MRIIRKIICLLLPAALLCAGLPAAAEGTPVRVGYEGRRFSVRIREGWTITPTEFTDWYTDEVFAGGLVFTAGGEEGAPRVLAARRSRMYDAAVYLGGCFPDSLEEYAGVEEEGVGIYTVGGRAMYGNRAVVYGAQGEELFREFRLIPADGRTGMEYAARYTAETEEEALALLDDLIRSCETDEEDQPEARFLPEGYGEEPDTRNGEYLLRVEDADRIEAEGYFTAALYVTDCYPAEDVRAMRAGDTVRIMDRVLAIEWIENDEAEEGYEIGMYAADTSGTGEAYFFTLIPAGDGSKYRAYFGEDHLSASRAGEVRVRVPQEEPVAYVCDSEDGEVLLSGDLFGGAEGDPALFGIGWNEYTHSCVFTDGKLARIITWDYPESPEDLFIAWQE